MLEGQDRPAEQGFAGDGEQHPLVPRSLSSPRLKPGVRLLLQHGRRKKATAGEQRAMSCAVRRWRCTLLSTGSIVLAGLPGTNVRQPPYGATQSGASSRSSVASLWCHAPPRPSRVGTSPSSACSDRATRRLTLTRRAPSVSSGKACASLATWRDRPSA